MLRNPLYILLRNPLYTIDRNIHIHSLRQFFGKLSWTKQRKVKHAEGLKYIMN